MLGHHGVANDFLSRRFSSRGTRQGSTPAAAGVVPM